MKSKNTEEDGRELKITILVTEEERIRIRRAALGDRKGRSVSTIGRELLLEYAEKMERKEGIENPQSRHLTEREQRETPENPDFTKEDIETFESMESELAETPIEEPSKEEESTPIVTEIPKKKTSKASKKREEGTPAKTETPKKEDRASWIKFSKNGIDSPFTEEEIEKAKEFIIGLLEKNPRGELPLITILTEGKPLGYRGGQLGDSITMNLDTFNYDYDNGGEIISLKKRKR